MKDSNWYFLSAFIVLSVFIVAGCGQSPTPINILAPIEVIASPSPSVTSVLPNLTEDRGMKDSDLFKELHKIAQTRDGKTFMLRDAFEEPASDVQSSLSPELRPLAGRFGHNDFILALAHLGSKLGYRVWIGKPEQARKVRGTKLATLSIDQIPIKMTTPQRRLLNQIDCIWFHDNIPVQAFEVEMSTDIEGALRRFYALLAVEPRVAGRMHVISNDSMKQKLQKVFTQSVYVGHPHLMQTKVNYCFMGPFVDHWNTLCNLNAPTEQQFLSVFNPGSAATSITVQRVRKEDVRSESQMELLVTENSDES